MVVFLSRRRCVLLFQKSHFFVFLGRLPRASWIQAVHLLNFILGDLRQVSDEVDEQPGLTIAFWCICALNRAGDRVAGGFKLCWRAGGERVQSGGWTHVDLCPASRAVRFQRRATATTTRRGGLPVGKRESNPRRLKPLTG